MHRLTLLAALIITLATAGVADAATNPTPRAAAAATRACLLEHGWSVKRTDSGAGLIGEAPRKLGGPLWRHPWYSISFSPGITIGSWHGALIEAHMSYRLNPHERWLAGVCTRHALR